MKKTLAPRRSPAWRLAIALTLSSCCWWAAGAQGQTWKTAATDPGYHQPPYAVAFVAALVRPNSNDSIGTDVLAANNPRGGHHLYILLANGAVKKLFPLPTHAQSGKILTSANELFKGTVVEPNVSEDGKTLYFSYFHDADNKASQTYLPVLGADLYRLDLEPLLGNSAYNPASLTVTRLTDRTIVNGQQVPTDHQRTAMNYGIAANTSLNNWGTVYMHATEMRQGGRLKLIYASDERRMRGSNNQASSYSNHNFNLHTAEISNEGNLVNKQQFQYYTTTSTMSPTRLRDGVAFSYQATTEDYRNWHIQSSDSAGRWAPLIGFGSNPGLFHLGTFCVDTSNPNQELRGDYFVATRYYNLNNEGFGAIYKQEMAKVGVNEYNDLTGSGARPRQWGSSKISQQVSDNDDPSPKVNGVYVGKLTTPRCARPNELFVAYTRTSANGRVPDPENNKHVFESYIAFRPDLQPFHPLDPVSFQNGTGLWPVVSDSTKTYSLVWPAPMVPWSKRSNGDVVQRSAPSTIDPRSTIQPGVPHAQVGTAALWNTDRKPFDCWLWMQSPSFAPFRPGKSSNNINSEKDLVIRNTDGLTYVKDPANPCLDLDPNLVLGIAVQITSNKPDVRFGYPGGQSGYQTFGGRHETSTLLGVYDIRNNERDDQSFQALIPAQTPFEFQLLDRNYGLKLTDVRSWHSLKPRETRTNCGGCHQHELGQQSYTFAGTDADIAGPLDMVNGTSYVDYDAQCKPMIKNSPWPALVSPEWKADLFSGLDLYCGACHSTQQVIGTPPSIQAFGYSDELDAYNQVTNRHYANSRAGALGSPLFWAARGQRADGRLNSDPKFQKNLGASDYGYFFTASHAQTPGLCASSDLAKARWVHTLGRWIDNHMPRDHGPLRGAKIDRFHPTVDFALADDSCTVGKIRIGTWDDSGYITDLSLEINGNLWGSVANTVVINGSFVVQVNGLLNDDILRIEAEDAADNRQMYEKRVREMIADCEVLNPPTAYIAP